MANSSWVCFECRLAVRRPTQHEEEVPCPQCGGACWGLGYKVPVPRKHDVRAWRELRESEVAEHQARTEASARGRVRARHELEQEIRRLEAMPENPGRAKAIRLLRRRLEGA
jgi:hypothetical protein